MKLIELTKGKQTLVDDEDYDFLSQWKWFFFPRCDHALSDRGYATRWTKNSDGVDVIEHGGHKFCKSKPLIYLHRVIAERMGLDIKQRVIHIDHNSLNNQRTNLMVGRPSWDATERYPGVSFCVTDNPAYAWRLKRGPWRARPRINGKKVHLGYFPTLRDAIAACESARAVVGQQLT